VLQVIERTEAGQRIRFENNLSDAPLPVSDDVLMEMTGPLLENATRYAVSRVRVSGDLGALVIEDDGPGLDPSQAEAVLERGKRLDESGHGLGLSIAHDLAQATGADLSLDRAPELGGLRVALRWPARAPG
jgi:signal transduction histidine kinase